ncbi:MAG TPA: hypothetical protein ENK64_04010 [Flavobacteriales bacterium]|nr:hypothetical protein [Flavobacteriales bacterium]
MKKAIVLFSLLFLVSACEKLDKLTQFNMEYNETITIPASAGIDLPFNIITPDVDTNSESTFEINDTRKDLIEKINLKTLDLTITSPPDADFSFLKSIKIYISAEGLPEVKIAWKDDIPANANKINLEVTDRDLKDYIKADKFKLRVETVTNELISQDHEIKVHAVFFVDAKILGI